MIDAQNSSATHKGFARMQSRLLHHFLTAYKHLNITTAAEELAITQPALTKSIHNLETDLGVILFERLPNGVMPTRFGDALARHCITIFLEYDHAVAEIEAMKGGSAGAIRIGAGPLWLTNLLPPAIAEFRRDHPTVQLLLDGALITTAIPGLLRGDIDMYCGSLDFPDQDGLIKYEFVQVERKRSISGVLPSGEIGEDHGSTNVKVDTYARPTLRVKSNSSQPRRASSIRREE